MKWKTLSLLPMPEEAVRSMLGELAGRLDVIIPDAHDRDATPVRDRPAAVPRVGRIVTLPFVLLGVVMACSTVVEGAASDWLGIYFNSVRGATPAASSAAYTVFAVAMAASRGAGTWTIGWLGRGRAVRASALLALAGVLVLLLAPVNGLAYVGAALWGLGTAIVFPAVISAAGDTAPGRAAQAISMVTPTTGPASDETAELVDYIREQADTIPEKYGIDAYVTGTTALNIDTADTLAAALPKYTAVVIGLALLLLMVVFRSVLVPIKAAAGFLLSIAAAMGVVVWVFQDGNLADLFSVAQAGPMTTSMT